MPHKTLTKPRVRTSSRKSSFLKTAHASADLLPRDQEYWKHILQTGFTIGELHDFHFIETPLIEDATLFQAGTGFSPAHFEEKVFSLLPTPQGARFVLRPDATVSVMRSYLEHQLGYYASPLRVFYHGPVFRTLKGISPQIIQFRQWGFEIIGENDPVYDVQVILSVLDFLKTLKIKDLALKINIMGCKVCAPGYRNKLRDYYTPKQEKLCDRCSSFLGKNPFRIFSCGEDGCRGLHPGAPIVLDHLCQSCNNYFKVIFELLEDNMLEYVPDPHLVQDFDYYNKIVFEISSRSLKSVLAMGGRYDYLSEMLGGRLLPSVGAALLLDPLLEAMRLQNMNLPLKPRSRVFFAAVGEQAKKSSLRFMHELRTHGVGVAEALGRKSLHSQLRVADKLRIPLALILGQREVFEGTMLVKDMKSGAQETVIVDNLLDVVRRRLKCP